MRKYNRITPEGETVFVGIDLHRFSWHITVISDGEVVFSGAHLPEPEKLLHFLGRYRPNRIEAVYEAGYFGFSLYELFTEAGIQCTVTPPTLVPMEYGNHVKTDRRDSRKLAYLLSKGMLKEVWVPPVEQLAHRQALRRRRQLIGDRVRVQQRIKSELSFLGIPVERNRDPWTTCFVNRLEELRFEDQCQQQNFDCLLEQYHFLCRLIVDQTKRIKELARVHYAEQVSLLRSIPGIGVISAMTIILELGDIRRFRKADQVAAYVGLTPSQYSSADKIRMGGITGCGNRSLRTTLVEVAWVSIGKDSELREIYENLKTRRGAKRAIVAVARRLLLRARRVLLDKQPYHLKQAA
jgi:transposase